MLRVYTQIDNRLELSESRGTGAPPFWFDPINPGPDEIVALNAQLLIDISTRAEMEESNCLRVFTQRAMPSS